MSVRALGAYEFPAADRQELYGDDQLVILQWDSNMLFCSAARFRVHKAMAWSDFKTEMIAPWASGDPDYRPDDATGWRLDDDEFDPRPDQTIGDLGVAHKGLIRFRTP